jgi:hypothetical protein
VTRKPRLSGGEIAGWTLAGFGIGLVAGALLGAFTGRGAPTRVRRALSGVKSRKPNAAPTIAGAAREVRGALARTDLSHFSIEVAPVRPGVVELHGWVPTRAIRARAARVASAVGGIERVINSLLVQGEDDKRLKPMATRSDQTA